MNGEMLKCLVALEQHVSALQWRIVQLEQKLGDREEGLTVRQQEVQTRWAERNLNILGRD